MNPRTLLDRLAHGQLTNVRFADAQRLAEALGFELDRVRGSHHIYRHRAIGSRINLQARGGQAKPYQLRQLLDLVERHALQLKDNDQ
ncbi:MAG: type II toxin-antitoxin system HicA family toxin [Actinomycetota bacterium]|nr:type II toxin-antitoxin system HicA family toxin [Actinomycetota bacterium]